MVVGWGGAYTKLLLDGREYLLNDTFLILALLRGITLKVQGEVLVLYVYQMRTDANGAENVAVEKVSFRKPVPAAA